MSSGDARAFVLISAYKNRMYITFKYVIFQYVIFFNERIYYGRENGPFPKPLGWHNTVLYSSTRPATRTLY